MTSLGVITPNKSSISLNEITIFETEFNLKLSNEFKQFLHEFNGGVATKSNILIKRVTQTGFIHESYLEEFYDFELVRKTYLYFYKEFPEDEIKNNEIIVIGKTNGNTMICIGVCSNNHGQILLWDWDFGVTNQSKNLESFFYSLEIDETVE